jgi:hypothetical protein
MLSVCPRSLKAFWFSRRSHTRRSFSVEPETSKVPARFIARLQMLSLCPSSLAASRSVPHTRRQQFPFHTQRSQTEVSGSRNRSSKNRHKQRRRRRSSAGHIPRGRESSSPMPTDSSDDPRSHTYMSATIKPTDTSPYILRGWTQCDTAVQPKSGLNTKICERYCNQGLQRQKCEPQESMPVL